MWFMRMPLDVLHVGKDDRVTHVLRGIKPWRFGPLFVGGKLAIELPAGVASSPPRRRGRGRGDLGALRGRRGGALGRQAEAVAGAWTETMVGAAGPST